MSTLRALAFVSIFTAAAAPAFADDSNPVGILVALQENTQSADAYLQYHGRMFVKVGKDTLSEYRWGGTSCGSRTLEENEVAMLQRALERKNMTIKPLSQSGQAQSQCLVGFTLVEKKNLKLFP